MSILQSEQKKKHKVLLVEDEFIVQKVHRMMLEKLGFEVDLAETASETLEKCAYKDYVMIFMDMGLPDGKGDDITRLIRKNNAKQSLVPIIVLTAYVQDEVREQCLAAGANEVHTKPITLLQLQNLIQVWMK